MRWFDILGGNAIQQAILSVEINFPLYHISLNENLEGKWKPQNPDGGSEQSTSLTEPNLPRISTAPSIEDCFRAIYPNVAQFFEEQNLPYMDFNVYNPMFNGTERVLNPETLSNYHLVHDAHATHEYCILDPVYMTHVQKVRIFNTNKSPDLNYFPFNDMKNSERFLAPLEVKYEVIHS